MNMKFKKVLALAPHGDDVEFGAGGTIHRLIREGAEVHMIVFSLAENSLPEGFPKDTLKREQCAAATVLGVKVKNIIFHHLPVRYFPQYRQDILEILVAKGREFWPDLVLVHTTTDVHQDHETVTQEAIRAFKRTTILGYELPHNTITFHGQCLINLTDDDVKKKIAAIQEYKSQIHRPYCSARYIEGWTHGRGVQIGEEFAEAFEVIRLCL